jgi:hypothetical protein
VRSDVLLEFSGTDCSGSDQEGLVAGVLAAFYVDGGEDLLAVRLIARRSGDRAQRDASTSGRFS